MAVTYQHGPITNRAVHYTLRLCVLKCYIWSVLLNGCETWTISTNIINTLEAAEMWFLKRMLKLSWTSHITNEEAMDRFGTS